MQAPVELIVSRLQDSISNNSIVVLNKGHILPGSVLPPLLSSLSRFRTLSFIFVDVLITINAMNEGKRSLLHNF